MASRRQRIIEAALARLGVILQDDGFNTDAGRNVLLNQVPELGEDDPDVAIAILLGDDEPRQQGHKILIGLPIELQAIAKVARPDAGGEWHPWIEAEQVLEDAKRAFELEDMKLGGLLNDDMERDVTSTSEREAGSTTVGLSIRYRLEYHEKWGAPEA